MLMSRERPIEPKVVVLSHNYPSKADPTLGVFIHNEVRALRSAGVDLRVVSPIPWSPKFLQIRKRWQNYASVIVDSEFEEIEVDRVACPYLPRPCHNINGLNVAARLLPRLRRLRNSFQFNLIHSHTLTPDGWAGCLLAKYFKVPTVCTIRGSDLLQYPHQSRVNRVASRFTLRQCDAVIATSNDLAIKASELERSTPCPATIYKGVDLSVFAPRQRVSDLRAEYGIPGDSCVIVFVGRCEQDKGLGELLSAFRGIHNSAPNTHLLIVGDGSFRIEMESFVRMHGLAQYVHLVGRVPQSTVARFLGASDIFVLPSYSEGMPNALLEAMACEMPCVATSVGGNAEAIVDGVSGLLIPPKDEAALHCAFGRLMRDREFATSLGQQAKRRIRSHFSWSENAAQNVRVYNSLLKATHINK